MKIFIDSADLSEIKKYMSWGLCDGVTTNPTICLQCGVTGGKKGIHARAEDIVKLISPHPLSLEVTTDDPEELLKEARAYAKLGENIAVKVTITDREGNSLLPVIHTLVSEGIRVNVTAITTFNQAILAAKTLESACRKASSIKFPHYVSIFAGRISEEQGVERAFKVIQDVRAWLDLYGYSNIEIIVGSVRSPENIEYWGRAGAHILTIPPSVIAKSLQGARTKETVAQFIEDSQKSLKKLR